MADEAPDAHGGGDAEAMQHGLVFCYVVGVGKVDLEYIAHSVFSWGDEDDSSSQPLHRHRSIKIQQPILEVDVLWDLLGIRPLDDEICMGLRLDG